MSGHFGAFGKMPALGDFFRIDLAQGFVDPWDRWLQQVLVAGRAALGGRWQDLYFTAPIWRFTLAPGLAGAAGMTGIMMMSVDRVGRQFPLTCAAPLPDGADPGASHLGETALFAALEAVALDALEDAMTREVLAARLAALPAPALPEGAAPRRAGGGLVLATAGAAAEALAADALRGAARRPSVWSAEFGGQTRLMVCEGLPAGGQVAALFDLAAPLWTGRAPDAPAMEPPAPGGVDPPARDAPRVAAARAPAATAAAAEADASPADDPLADILADHPPALEPDGGDDPLAAILAAGDPLAGDGAPPPEEA